MRIGQPAKVVTDFYGDKVVFTGTAYRVDYRAPAAPSSCCLRRMPAVTGSSSSSVCRCVSRWIRHSWEKYPLRIDSSGDVTVTQNTDGPVLSRCVRTDPAYHTSALSIERKPADQMHR